MTHDFSSPGELRGLLCRLHAAGPGSWRHDPDASDLMAYTLDKYAALSVKHHLDPGDGAYAAFEALRTLAVRTAEDPWSVVTRAVQVELIAEERANGILCSTDQARRPENSAGHDAERFGERDTPLTDFHPAFRVLDGIDIERLGEITKATTAAMNGTDATTNDVRQPDPTEPTTAKEAIELSAILFASLGWPQSLANIAMAYVEAKLMTSKNRPAAHGYLRRDALALDALDLSPKTWTTLLTTVLGDPREEHEYTRRGRGLLLRFVIGDTLQEMLEERRLVVAIAGSAPRLVPINRYRKVLEDLKELDHA